MHILHTCNTHKLGIYILEFPLNNTIMIIKFQVDILKVSMYACILLVTGKASIKKHLRGPVPGIFQIKFK